MKIMKRAYLLDFHFVKCRILNWALSDFLKLKNIKIRALCHFYTLIRSKIGFITFLNHKGLILKLADPPTPHRKCGGHSGGYGHISFTLLINYFLPKIGFCGAGAVPARTIYRVGADTGRTICIVIWDILVLNEKYN